MSQTYDNDCDECGQDRDAQRRNRALTTACTVITEHLVTALMRAERAEQDALLLRLRIKELEAKPPTP